MPLRDPPLSWPPGLVAVYAEHRLAFVRLAYLITGDRHTAEEVVQDAFLHAARAWSRVSNPNAYLRAAVVNGARSRLRRRNLERRHEERIVEATHAAPDELWDVLARLNPKRRAALVLRYYEALPDATIAEILECRPATVRTLVRRALADLRKELEP